MNLPQQDVGLRHAAGPQLQCLDSRRGGSLGEAKLGKRTPAQVRIDGARKRSIAQAAHRWLRRATCRRGPRGDRVGRFAVDGLVEPDLHPAAAAVAAINLVVPTVAFATI